MYNRGSRLNHTRKSRLPRKSRVVRQLAHLETRYTVLYGIPVLLLSWKIGIFRVTGWINRSYCRKGEIENPVYLAFNIRTHLSLLSRETSISVFPLRTKKEMKNFPSVLLQLKEVHVFQIVNQFRVTIPDREQILVGPPIDQNWLKFVNKRNWKSYCVATHRR